MFLQVLLFAFIPVIFMILGGAQVYIKEPSGKFNSIVQHFAAGLIFSTVAVELVPKVVGHSKELLVLGFVLGIMTMMFSEHIAHNLPSKLKNSSKSLPIAFLIAIGLDIFIDGILIGATFLSEFKSGILVSLAVAFEVLILGIAVIIRLQRGESKKLNNFVILLAISLLIPLGTTIGYSSLSLLPHKVHIFILSFSMVALLYLVTEELLIDAHKQNNDTQYDIIFFFVGFLIVFLV